MGELFVDLTRDFEKELHEDSGRVLFLDDPGYEEPKYRPFNHPVPQMQYRKPRGFKLRALASVLWVLGVRREFRFAIRCQPRSTVSLDDLARMLVERHGVPKGESKPVDDDKAVWVWGLVRGRDFKEALLKLTPFVEKISKDADLEIIRMQLEFVEAKEI